MIKLWCYWLLLPHSIRETIYLQPCCWKTHNNPFGSVAFYLFLEKQSIISWCVSGQRHSVTDSTNGSETGFLLQWFLLPSEVDMWYLFIQYIYTVIYLCCSVVDHLSVVHFFILTFSLFSLSILFHDWQRAFLVNQPSLTWFQPYFKPSSSSSPHCSPDSLYPSFLPLFCWCAFIFWLMVKTVL